MVQLFREAGDDMTNGAPLWSMRAVVISVRDLDRSSSFYQDVMSLSEVLREDQIVVLGSNLNPSFTLYLREAHRNAAHPGQALGVRAFSCDVGSFAELDRVEGRLRALNAFRDRHFLDEAEQFEMIHGQDPDRLSLVFVAHENALALKDYRRALASLYAIDL
jgi:catechol 2,3-dioxygenase-like lactoylglutathione lyase family enzyme